MTVTVTVTGSLTDLEARSRGRTRWEQNGAATIQNGVFVCPTSDAILVASASWRCLCRSCVQTMSMRVVKAVIAPKRSKSARKIWSELVLAVATVPADWRLLPVAVVLLVASTLALALPALVPHSVRHRPQAQSPAADERAVERDEAVPGLTG